MSHNHLVTSFNSASKDRTVLSAHSSTRKKDIVIINTKLEKKATLIYDLPDSPIRVQKEQLKPISSTIQAEIVKNSRIKVKEIKLANKKEILRLSHENLQSENQGSTYRQSIALEGKGFQQQKNKVSLPQVQKFEEDYSFELKNSQESNQ